MQFTRFFSCVLLLAVGALAGAQPVKRDLTIELRQIEEGRDALEGYRAGATADTTAWSPQTLWVRNGEKATLRMQQSVPMQWVKSAQVQNSSLKAGGAVASSTGGGVTHALHWFNVGQSMTVTPKWPGGKKDVALEIEIEVEQADMQTVHNADLPRQTRNQINTVITVPLNTWVTMAASGRGAAPAGSYSSEAGTDARRLLQVRVTAP